MKRAPIEPPAGSCAARDLQDARGWKASGDPRGVKLERAILKGAKDLEAWRLAHPWDCSPEGRAWYLEHTIWGERERQRIAREAESLAA